MDYNFSIPNIYKDNYINNNKNENKILEKTIFLEANKKYDLLKICNFNDIYEIIALYFKTNSSYIYLCIQQNEILIYNNFLFIDQYNCRSYNNYIIYSTEIDSELTIYILQNIYSPIKTYAKILYDKQSNNNKINFFYNAKYIEKTLLPFCACPQLNITRITIQLHFLTKKDDFHIKNKIIKFISNDIIFYYGVNKIKKINQLQYLYILNLIKLENIDNSNNIIVNIKYNIIDINNIEEYFYIFEKEYNMICYFLFEQHKNLYYDIDYKNFMIKYEIDRLWYMNLIWS